ncbi:hypothetical protein APR08_004549 [Nocardia amikacinitolerans]|nr:hypothetical protein [Nocardia amikacinitolerans]
MLGGRGTAARDLAGALARTLLAAGLSLGGLLSSITLALGRVRSAAGLTLPRGGIGPTGRSACASGPRLCRHGSASPGSTCCAGLSGSARGGSVRSRGIGLGRAGGSTAPRVGFCGRACRSGAGCAGCGSGHTLLPGGSPSSRGGCCRSRAGRSSRLGRGRVAARNLGGRRVERAGPFAAGARTTVGLALWRSCCGRCSSAEDVRALRNLGRRGVRWSGPTGVRCPGGRPARAARLGRGGLVLIPGRAETSTRDDPRLTRIRCVPSVARRIGGFRGRFRVSRGGGHGLGRNGAPGVLRHDGTLVARVPRSRLIGGTGVACRVVLVVRVGHLLPLAPADL